MRHLRGTYGAAILTLLLTLIPISSGWASSIVVDPIKESITVEDGALADLTLTLTNNTASTKAVNITFAEFTVDNNGVPSLLDSPSEANPAAWFKADQASFTMAVDETRAINMTVDVPLNVPAKGYYVMAVSSIRAAEEQVAANTTAQELQTLYSLTVGAPVENLEILQVAPATRSVAITLKNPVDVHTTASGKMDIFVNDQIDTTYSIPPINIFPGKSRTTSIALEEAPGEKYEVRLTLAYGRNNRVITRTASFPEDVTPEMINDETTSHSVRNQVEVVQDKSVDRTVLYGVAGAGLLLAAAGVFVALRRR